MTNEFKASENWNDDLLGRASNANFLEKYVLRRFSKSDDQPSVGSLCFAVDGDWGAGKSYFVDRWRKDLSKNGHLVVHFDAWANDLADDPLVGFMASLRGQIAPWIKKLPIANRVQAEGKKTWKKIVSNAGRVVLPVAKVIAAGAMKKISGIDPEDLLGAFSQDSETEEAEQHGESISKELVKNSATVAGKMFEEVMRNHDDRRAAVSQLRENLEELIKYLSEHAQALMPMFVFIDELDRCRPDYAIRLLEGVKHLFEANGICFVISTNLSQLSESTRAIYGSGFDSKRYLKRFFAFEYMLPQPDHKAFAAGLFSTSLFQNLPVHGSLPNQKQSISENFALVCEAFELDLRSQKQILLYSEAAVSSISKGEFIYCLPLFFLAALLHRDRTIFNSIEKSWTETGEFSVATLHPAGFKDSKVTYKSRNRNQVQDEVISCSDIFSHYLKVVSKPISNFSREFWNSDRYQHYPNNLLREIAEEANGKTPPGDRSTAHQYPRLLRAAGQLS